MGGHSAQGLIQSLKNARNEVTIHYGARTSRSLQATGAAGVATIAVGVGKLIMGILSSSMLLCVSAFCTLGMATAKYTALAGVVKSANTQDQFRYYRSAAMILIGVSLLFIAYSVQLHTSPSDTAYPMVVAIAIAAFAFAEVAVHVRGVLVTRNGSAPCVHAIKNVNLAAAFLCIALAQAAILSFSSEAVELHPAANGAIGALMGGASVLLGICMMRRVRKMKCDSEGTNMINILVVEDDPALNQVVCTYLNDSGFHAKGCLSAGSAYDELYNNLYELIVSDIMMPQIDGFEFARTVRQVNKHIPILFMSAKDDLPSKQKGFQLGIDDYMVKPIELGELLIRVRALLRRANVETERKLAAGNLLLDADAMTAEVDGVEIPITTREFNLIYKLLSYPKKTFTRAQLMDEFWGIESETSLRAVDVYVTKLRDKFSVCDGFDIVTVRGIGYKAVLR